MPVDEYDWHFINELAFKPVVGFDVHFARQEAAPAFQFDQLFFHDLAKMTASSRVHDHLRQLHARSLAKQMSPFQPELPNFPAGHGYFGNDSLDTLNLFLAPMTCGRSLFLAISVSFRRYRAAFAVSPTVSAFAAAP